MVRDVFRLARENSPSVVFIDEIDAIATKRFDAQTGADREVQRILLELLNQMDGFDQSTNVKVGHTYRKSSLELPPPGGDFLSLVMKNPPQGGAEKPCFQAER